MEKTMNKTKKRLLKSTQRMYELGAIDKATLDRFKRIIGDGPKVKKVLPKQTKF